MNTRSAIILAVGLIVAGLVHGGFYQVVPSGENRIHRVNKWTGAVVFCVGYLQCGPVQEKSQK